MHKDLGAAWDAYPELQGDKAVIGALCIVHLVRSFLEGRAARCEVVLECVLEHSAGAGGRHAGECVAHCDRPDPAIGLFQAREAGSGNVVEQGVVCGAGVDGRDDGPEVVPAGVRQAVRLRDGLEGKGRRACGPGSWGEGEHAVDDVGWSLGEADRRRLWHGYAVEVRPVGVETVSLG